MPEKKPELIDKNSFQKFVDSMSKSGEKQIRHAEIRLRYHKAILEILNREIARLLMVAEPDYEKVHSRTIQQLETQAKIELLEMQLE